MCMSGLVLLIDLLRGQRSFCEKPPPSGLPRSAEMMSQQKVILLDLVLPWRFLLFLESPPVCLGHPLGSDWSSVQFLMFPHSWNVFGRTFNSFGVSSWWMSDWIWKQLIYHPAWAVRLRPPQTQLCHHHSWSSLICLIWLWSPCIFLHLCSWFGSHVVPSSENSAGPSVHQTSAAAPQNPSSSHHLSFPCTCRVQTQTSEPHDYMTNVDSVFALKLFNRSCTESGGHACPCRNHHPTIGDRCVHELHPANSLWENPLRGNFRFN